MKLKISNFTDGVGGNETPVVEKHSTFNIQSAFNECPNAKVLGARRSNGKMESVHGFTLLEVMIAIAIFFVASFAILGLISTSLNNVRRLQRPTVDASPLLAHYEATNSLIEGVYQGNLGEPELLGKDYRDYNYVVTIEEVESNHLYAVNCKIFQTYGKHDPISDLTTVLYKPQSPAGSLDGGIGMTGK
jgi:prepilin-type N-terminal cleavage/methylation domain-containing protein